mgnify:FL=1
MLRTIKNTEEEDLYIITVVSTNDIQPHVIASTWEGCIKRLGQLTLEADNDRFFAQLIHKEINKDCHRAEASMRCNKKGWGSDYFQYITIEPLYTDT